MTHDAPLPAVALRPSRRLWWHALAALALMCLTVGVVFLVTRRDRAANAASDVPAGASEIRTYTADELSTLGDTLPDLDEDRLRAAPPVDWDVAPRGEGYVARFVFDRTFPLPRITIEAQATSFPQPRDVSRANLREFWAQYVGSSAGGTRPAMESRFWTLVLGDVPCLAYQMQRTFEVGGGLYPGDSEVLVTLHDGRIYTVTLDVQAGQLDDYRADAWAVMAGLQFP